MGILTVEPTVKPRSKSDFRVIQPETTFTGAASVGAYLQGLPSWEEFSPPLPAQPPTVVGDADPVRSAVSRRALPVSANLRAVCVSLRSSHRPPPSITQPFCSGTMTSPRQITCCVVPSARCCSRDPWLTKSFATIVTRSSQARSCGIACRGGGSPGSRRHP